MDYDKFCRRCVHYSFSIANGIICNLTDSKPDFGVECEHFKHEPEREKQAQTKTNKTSSVKPPNELGFSWGALGLNGIWLIFHGRADAFIKLLAFGLIIPMISRWMLTSIHYMSVIVGILLYAIAIISPLAALIMAINYAINGQEIAWESNNYRSFEELKRGERGWEIAGVITMVVISLLIIGIYAIIASVNL